MTYREKEKYKFYGIVGLIILIFSSVMYYMYAKNNQTYRNITKSVSINKPDLLEHELKTNDGFKVVLTGNCQATNPIINTQYLQSSKEFLYLDQTTEKYTRHTRTVTDSEGHSHTETYYTWDNYDTKINQIRDFQLLNHHFKNISLDFNNVSRLDIKKYINDNFKNKISGNYIYLDNKYLYLVGDKRIYFEGVLNKSNVSLAGELGNKTIQPYKKYTKVLVYDGDKESVRQQLRQNGKMIIIVYVIGLIVIVIGGCWFYKDEF